MKRAKRARASLKILLVLALTVPGTFSPSPSYQQEVLAASPIESIIAGLVPNDPPGVSNPDSYIGDQEILQALDFWIRGRPVPGAGKVISDMQMLTLIDAWIKQRSVVSLVEEISKTIGSKGGVIETQSGAKVSISAGILRQDTSVSVTVLSSPTDPLPEGVSMVGYEIQVKLSAQALTSSSLTHGPIPLQQSADERAISIEIPLLIAATESQLVHVTVLHVEESSTALQARYSPAGVLNTVWEGIGKVGKGVVNVGKSAWAGVKRGTVWIKAKVVDFGNKVKQAIQRIQKWIQEISLSSVAVQIYQQLGLVTRDLGMLFSPLDEDAQLVVLKNDQEGKFKESVQQLVNGSKHLLILVHGIQLTGQELDWNIITPNAWKEFTALFYGDPELRATYELFGLEYVTSKSIENNGQEFADIVNRVANSMKKKNPDGKIVILAHSMGGLVAKSALVQWNANIDAVITLGTPYHGSPLASVPESLTREGLISCSVTLGQECGQMGVGLLAQLLLETPGFQQLKWDGFDGKIKGANPWLSRLNQNHDFDDRFIAYASRNSACSGELLVAQLLLLKLGWTDTGDCVVPYSSGAFVDMNDHPQVGKVRDVIPSIDHSTLHKGRNVFNQVRDDLCRIADGCKVRPISKLPTASFVFNPSNPKVNEITQFTDQSSDPDNDIQSWFWDFGDGATSSSRNPTHAYSHSGSFTVTLTVRDKAGNIATVQKTINVQEKPQLKPFVYIVKTIRSDSDNVIDLTSSNPNDGSRDVIFRVTITNDGDADARVRVVDDMAGGAYRCADPGAPCEKDNLLVQARSSFSYEYRARYVGSETRDGAAVVNTARIVWIDGYYDESRRIDLGGHGTLRSSVTAYLRNPPKARPEIISIEFPSEISADGNEYNGTVRFRDQDGDVAWIQFDVVLGNWKPNGWDPQVFGLTNGTIGFTNRCYVPETVRLKVTLRDRAGNESAPFNFTFRCVNPVGPPVITRIDFPREIFANSQPVEGRVYFTSPNSNVNRAKFEVLVGTWNSLDFNPAQSLVSGTLQGGIFTFTVQCNSPEDGRFRVTLYNEAGLASRSEEFSFTCSPIYRNEICGNGIDDDGDGYIDEGCSTISILLEDTGNVKDDVFRLFIDGVEIPPDTPVGGRRYYSIDGLSRGRHTVEVFVVRDTDPPGTFTLTLSGGAVFEDGGTQHDCTRSSLDCPKRGESRTFTIIVP
jgi:PKD repeat protein